MQVNQPKGGNAEATTPRYDTIVIRGAQGSAVPKEVDGGEVISWSRGHELAGMDALEKFVEDLAAGDCLYPASITERAQQALVLMKLRRVHGWDAESARGEQSDPINYGELDPVQRLAVCRGTPYRWQRMGIKKELVIMSDFFYKSSEPATVAIVREFYAQKDILIAQMAVLGSMFGGKVAPMRDITSHFAGGVKLTGGAELDAHWCRPDDYGYRSLRSTAKLAKGISKEDRAAIRAEHQRLVALWAEHCPKRLSSHEYWQRLGVNTGHLLMSGGIKLELDGTAFFHLGFQINEAEHLANVAAGKPSCGWIDGAVEILASQYESARVAKLKAVEVSNA